MPAGNIARLPLSDFQERCFWDIAVEHVAWAAEAGLTPKRVILSVDQALPVDPNWSDALYALVYAQHAMHRIAGAKARAA